ncbi:MAG: 5'/3'-nucleotidase SurE, partial [candidate division NC10 bacterium]
FTAAAAFARRLATLLLEQGLPPDTLLNVNVPAAPPERILEVALTRQGRRAYRESIVEKLDPRGKTYYWIGGSEPEWERLGDSDYDAVMAGKISVTPLHLDLTHYEALRALRAWEERLRG